MIVKVTTFDSKVHIVEEDGTWNAFIQAVLSNGFVLGKGCYINRMAVAMMELVESHDNVVSFPAAKALTTDEELIP